LLKLYIYGSICRQMKDIHITKNKKFIDIDEVGVSDVLFPITIRDKSGECRQVTANIKLSVDLSNGQKGTHMSRFLEAINRFAEHTFNEGEVIKLLLQDIKNSFHSNTAVAELSFTFFIPKEAPVSKKCSLMGYACALGGKIDRDDIITLSTKVCAPISTVCPCSKEISSIGAHNQRGQVELSITSKEPVCLEDLISLIERGGSERVYPLLKRVDEKRVTERMFKNPKFVEDVVRDIARKLKKDKRIIDFNMHCTNFESIHQHNVYAKISMSSKK